MDRPLNETECIEGVSIFDLRVISDDRGAVLHMLRSDAADFIGFGECYFSEIKPGAVKAWKLHRKQTQNFAVPVGRIKLVLFDRRLDSRTLGRVQVIELGRPDAYYRIRISPGIWYGFSCISSEPALLVNCADLRHDRLESDNLDFYHPDFPYLFM